MGVTAKQRRTLLSIARALDALAKTEGRDG